MTKYRVGDEVTVRATVLKVEIDSLAVGITSEDGEATHYTHGVPFSEIATHTPKPREFKPGDMVTWGTGAESFELVAVRDEYAIVWCKEYAEAYKGPLSKIRHADEAE